MGIWVVVVGLHRHCLVRVKRKIISDSSDDAEDPDKTMTMETDNNNPDVLKDIDSFLASSSEETAPLVSDNSNWMHLAKRLNREERESVSKRFSEELRLLSSGLLKEKGFRNAMSLFQVPQMTQLQLAAMLMMKTPK